MNKLISFLFVLSMYVCNIQSAQIDKQNSTPSAPPVVQVSTQGDPEYHSYLRDVCQCIAVPCSAVTGCCGNECRFIRTNRKPRCLLRPGMNVG